MISIKSSSCTFRAVWLFRSHQYRCSIIWERNVYRLITTAVIGWITDALSVMAVVTDFSLHCLAAQSWAGIYVDLQTQEYTVSLSLCLSASPPLLCYGFSNVSACVWNVKSLNVELVGNVKERRGILVECPFSYRNIFTRAIAKHSQFH